MRIRITLCAVLTSTMCFGFGLRSEALPVPAPKYTPLVEYPNVAEAATKALNIDKWYRMALWNNTVLWNRTVEQSRQRAVTGASSHQLRVQPVSVSTPSSSSGHDPCAEPELGILPSYIVNRESRGQCGAYNAGGCGGRGCIGWAQVDAGHFWARSPWGGQGTCYGLSYNACVNKLSNGGTNLAPWGA